MQHTFQTQKRNHNEHWNWESPDGKVRNRIDYALVNSKWKGSITNCRALPSADIESDYKLVICNVRLKLRAMKMKKLARKYDTNKLKDATTSAQCIITISVRWSLRSTNGWYGWWGLWTWMNYGRKLKTLSTRPPRMYLEGSKEGREKSGLQKTQPHSQRKGGNLSQES